MEGVSMMQDEEEQMESDMAWPGSVSGEGVEGVWREGPDSTMLSSRLLAWTLCSMPLSFFTASEGKMV